MLGKTPRFPPPSSVISIASRSSGVIDARFATAVAPNCVKKKLERKWKGSYVLQVGQRPIFSVNDFRTALTHLEAMDSPPPKVDIILAQDRIDHRLKFLLDSPVTNSPVPDSPVTGSTLRLIQLCYALSNLL